jgi:hypothetical protein
MPKSPTLTDLAARYSCDRRTITNWKRQGAPLHDPKRMRRWLAGRKNLPPGTRGQLATEANARRAKVAADAEGSVNIGAAAALKRLEAAEVKAFALLQNAIQAGDPFEVKTARENWLKIGDSLRRYDLLVAKERRETGELVQRGEVEKHIARFIQHLKIALLRVSHTLAAEVAAAPSSADAHALLWPAIFDQAINSLAVLAVAPSQMALPPWFIDAAIKPIGDTINDAPGLFAERAKAVKEMLEALAEATTRRQGLPADANPSTL